MKTLVNNLKIVSTMVPVLANDDTEGTGVGVDCRGYHKVLMVAQQGISGDTLSGSVKWDILFEESDDNSTFTTIPDADLIGGYGKHTIDAAAEDPTLVVREYTGGHRYVRISWDASGTHTNGTPIAGFVALGHPLMAPVTQVTELGTDTSSEG